MASVPDTEEQTPPKSSSSSNSLVPSTASNYEYYEYKRSRSNTPISEPNTLDFSFYELDDLSYQIGLSIQKDEHLNINTILTIKASMAA